MSFYIKNILVVILIVLCLYRSSIAEDMAVPQSMLATWTSFKEAVRNGDKDTVISLSSFPIRSNDLGGTIKSKNELTKRFNKIFDSWVKTCFESNQPEKAPESLGYIVNCNGYFFGFLPQAGVYRFSFIDNVNE